jgi:hypothetical protein
LTQAIEWLVPHACSAQVAHAGASRHGLSFSINLLICHDTSTVKQNIAHVLLLCNDKKTMQSHQLRQEYVQGFPKKNIVYSARSFPDKLVFRQEQRAKQIVLDNSGWLGLIWAASV